MFSRILSNTRKHITRSGWIGFASIFTMSLAFIVVTIFGSLAFVSNLYLNYIESRSNLFVFFAEGMDLNIIDELKVKWQTIPDIKNITYLSEEDAYNDYSAYAQRAKLEDIYEVLQIKDDKKLDSSLEIQLYSLNNLEQIQKTLQKDIDLKLKDLIIINTSTVAPPITQTTDPLTTSPQTNVVETAPIDGAVITNPGTTTDTANTTNPSTALEPTIEVNPAQVTYKYSLDPTVPPISLKVNSDTLAAFSQMFSELRVAGLVIISLLVLVVVFFIFMTTEFRLFNQMEEIGVMQLVGGSLSFIRAPYILEGGFYGFMGAFISSGLIALSAFVIMNGRVEIATFSFIIQNFAQLPWPEITTGGWVTLFLGSCGIGFVLGSVSSYLSIRRYIR